MPLRMNMRKFIPIIFSILILLVLILGSGCVTESSPSQINPQDIGITQTVQADNFRISFEEAKAKLTDYKMNALNEPVNTTTVNYMRSRDVDGSGNATGWIFGVYRGGMAEFLVYDRTGWTTIANATFPSEEIVLDSVVSPDFLFKKNKEMISGNPSPTIPERWDIELQRGIYKLIITSGSTHRTLTFNATTGTLIT
jgi:hypothetical protein